jgi:ABC-2 type transport system ATP-binding protein
MQNFLEIRNLTKSYGDFSLQDVDLDVPAGTITGLVGANGAGKSTLLKLVLGLLPPDKGEIKIFGQDALCDSTILRKKIGFVQESPTLYSHLRIKEIGRLVAPFYPDWNKTEFKRLCSLFEIPLKTPFKKMSQGTRMKTALVLALSHDADLLLLDEPTSGLDPLVRREVLDLLLDVIQDKNKAVLFSTHITSDLDRVADHVAIIKKGKMVLTGEKDELLESWALVKGGEELLSESLKDCCYGAERTESGLILLCRKNGNLEKILPSDVLPEHPNLEDLVYFYGRELGGISCSH